MHTKHLLAVALVVLTPASGIYAQDRGRVPQGPAGTVSLPIGEYNRLVDRASQPDRTPEAPPIAAVVGRADLRARVAGETARGTLRLEGEVFQRGQVKVPLVSGATLVDARADGRPLPLLHEADSHVAVLPGPAPFTISLEWAAPVTAVPGRASFALPVPVAGSVSAAVDLPGDPAEIRIDGGLVTRRQTASGRTTVDVSLEPGRPVQVSWSVRETGVQVTPAAARTLADVKSLVTIGEADLRMVTLIDLTVVQGQPGSFEVRLPPGFDVTSITGSTLDNHEPRPGALVLTVRDPSVRRHQFLIGLEQAHSPGSFKVETSFPTVTGAQREVGETAIEGIGTIDVTASGDEGLRRMDVRETHGALRSLARQPLLAAFRYQRRPEEKRVLTLDVKRYSDAAVIAAVAERVVATTLVTTEGRALTEVALSIRNRAQPFMKVTLPTGATMLSVEVAGEAAKPVTASDGTRVPLLRSGFKTDGVYSVSFVYLNAGEAFKKSGDTQLALPRFDVPVSILEWELFLPDRYSAKPNGGNVIPSRFTAAGAYGGIAGGVVGGVIGGLPNAGSGTGSGTGRGTGPGMAKGVGGIAPPVGPGQIIGRVTDSTGAEIPGATIILRTPDGRSRQAVSDANGLYAFYGVPSGNLTVTSELNGFRTSKRTFTFDQRPRRVDFELSVAAVTETVEVRGETPPLVEQGAERTTTIRPNEERTRDEVQRENEQKRQVQAPPSQNVLNLQRRVSGVLPVRIDVPRTGTSYTFVRPLVLDEETTVSFRYKRR